MNYKYNSKKIIFKLSIFNIIFKKNFDNQFSISSYDFSGGTLWNKGLSKSPGKKYRGAQQFWKAIIYFGELKLITIFSMHVCHTVS